MMERVTGWQKWVRHPQRVWLRRMVFQIHLWTGIGVGVYVTLLSLSGSLLVYRNELFQAATAARVITTTVGDRLTDDQLKDAAERAYPGFRVSRMNSGRRRNQAV